MLVGSPLHWRHDCIAEALERRDAVLDFEMPAAVKWIVIAGDCPYAGAVDGKRVGPQNASVTSEGS